MTDVVVTGVGSIDASTGPYTRHPPSRGVRHLAPATRHALAAAELALAAAGLKPDSYPQVSQGVAIGTNFGGTATLARMDRSVIEQGAAGLRPIEAPNFAANLPGSHVSIRYGLKAMNLTLTTPLVAGLQAVLQAGAALRSGRALMMLAGATEGTPPPEWATTVSTAGGTAVSPAGGVPVTEGGCCLLTLETGSEAGQRALSRIGSGTSWFLPPSLCRDGEGRRRLRGLAGEGVRRLLRRDGDVLLIAPAHPLGEIVTEALRDQGAAVTVSNDVTSASMAPLLALTGALARHRPTLLAAVSPNGHIAAVSIEHD
ncbi:hypothetical protein J4573_02350 [Actinomadura barringtoniae]|uniref:Beta-ketoacyl synthase-like N-terminal domain-containing protein n=1 Tax=Actinomadura barringtoniae TaxID=1427535 RepID=A0A939P697_9ACTN|nr:beta-ketoacyl synthase N-terminal-like domain-containing protein [Actinomadura barringtoniae]MBO2445920.1 hypothetical protein [Actinomadura barringtoniae]